MVDPITSLTPPRFDLAEGAVWDDQTNTLLFCDILGHAIWAFDWETQALRSWVFEKTVGSFGLCKDGGLIVAHHDEILLFDKETGAREVLVQIEANDDRTRLNDGKVGPDGAFWVGTMDDRSPRKPIAALYRVAPEGTVRKIAEEIHVSNGLAWSPDGSQMFHSDSSTGRVDRYDFDPTTGALSNRTQYLQLDNTLGRPDGGTIDADGNYWSAGVSAGNVNCFSPGGNLIMSIGMPAPRPTMPCFAGPDLDHLVVTTLKPHSDPELMTKYPLSGSVFVMTPGAKGVPSHRFG
ncbi:SMP-30/gluconolactonase/LRE family protein [Pseudovibrio sp. SPO723]|uniref:SMP-30/gluconolactonase/LRE family protein n=1 Tax=Nesiotobacter zosterae TaxID=392721 RepID=UPI0029C59DF5|nr:SMP-30/gluconolactonase/LRE family protein [Pseudovibrio sp. SPO723]MDX5594095.1 SMP-30/gluconolactonase/LRE family protein [Pseudovibrio sp. SPO723]